MRPGPNPNRPPIYQSPWYWVYLFSVAGLIVLLIAQPKLASRQTQIERLSQGRSRAMSDSRQSMPNTDSTGGSSQNNESPPPSTSNTNHISFTPLYVVLGIGVVVGWIMSWRPVPLGRQRPRRQRPKGPPIQRTENAAKPP